MSKVNTRQKLTSYVSAVLALVMVIWGLLRLPRLGDATIGGLFTLAWLSFALLIIASHLRILVKEEPAPKPALAPQAMRSEEKRRISKRATQS